jgi:hypothetical protein
VLAVIEITIDELVVRGLTPSEARAAAAALEGRLAALAGDAGTPLSPRAEAFRRLPAVRTAGGATALGETVAGSVWAALGRTGSDPHTSSTVVTDDPQGRSGR